jgi:hypothetical protein
MTTMTKTQTIREITATTEAAARVDLLRELAAARAHYEERLGWPVTIDVRPGRLVMLTGPIADAVTMPASLGRMVLADLRIAMFGGPVVADPSGRSWMFFTAPLRNSGFELTEDLATELSRLDIELMPTETYVVVPTHLDGTNTWPWIERPKPQRDLPPLPAVIATARRNGCRLHGLA